jgi:hypothetical protein
MEKRLFKHYFLGRESKESQENVKMYRKLRREEENEFCEYKTKQSWR